MVFVKGIVEAVAPGSEHGAVSAEINDCPALDEAESLEPMHSNLELDLV